MASCREPLPPPYPVGAKVAYTGPRITYQAIGDERPRTLDPGDVGVVTELRPGWQGTGRPIPMEDCDDEQLYDDTHDGWCVVKFPGGVERAVDASSRYYQRVTK